MQYFIGIDLGTSAVKLLLVDESGKICSTVSRDYPLFFPHPGWSEQNPEDWWAAVQDGLKELTKDIDVNDVAGVGCGGQMHGLVILDENDQVIRPAILWNDGRTFKEVDYLNNVNTSCPSSPPTSPLPASPHPNSCGCRRTSPRTLSAFAELCCPRISLTISSPVFMPVITLMPPVCFCWT